MLPSHSSRVSAAQCSAAIDRARELHSTEVVAGYLQYGLLKLQLLSNKRGFESSRGNEKLDGRHRVAKRETYI